MYDIFPIDAAMNKTEKKTIESKYKDQKKNRPWIDVDSELTTAKPDERREKKHVRITMIPLFCTEIDMKSIKIYSWSNEKLCVLNSFSRFLFLFLFFHLVSFALCCDGFIWADLFTCFSSRSLSHGTIKNTHASHTNSHTSSEHYCAGASTLPCLRLSIRFVFGVLLLLLFFSLDLFFGLFRFCFWSDFVACCCSNAGAAGVLFLLHTQTQSSHFMCVQGNPMWDSLHLIPYPIFELSLRMYGIVRYKQDCQNWFRKLCSCCLGSIKRHFISKTQQMINRTKESMRSAGWYHANINTFRSVGTFFMHSLQSTRLQR